MKSKFDQTSINKFVRFLERRNEWPKILPSTSYFFAKEVCIDDNADFGNLSQKIGRAQKLNDLEIIVIHNNGCNRFMQYALLGSTNLRSIQYLHGKSNFQNIANMQQMSLTFSR